MITATAETGAVTELVMAVANLTDSDSISFVDVDITDTHTATVTTINYSPLGTLMSIVNVDTGTIDWDFSAEASALEYLAAGETKVETFMITLNDENGDLVNREVNVTIRGTNDAPTVTTAMGTTQVENNGATTSTEVATFTAIYLDGDDIT